MIGALEVVAEAKVVILVIVPNIFVGFLNCQLLFAVREVWPNSRYTTRSISYLKILFLISILVFAFSQNIYKLEKKECNYTS